MIIDSNNLLKSTHHDFTYCIIGGGVAGITLANELESSGESICILEGGDESFTLDSQSLYAPETPPTQYEDTTYNRLRFLGGSSNHWENNTSEFTTLDFEQRDWVPDSDWPISYDDVKTFYTQAANYCGTGEDSYNTEFWSKKFDISDPLENSNNLKTNIVKASTPPTRFFQNFGDNLKKSENVKVFKNANFNDIDFNEINKKIEKVTFSNYSKIQHTVNAQFFILCTGGIENARLMLIINEKYKNKVGNRYDNVGRYFMEHPVLRAAKLYPTDKAHFSIYTMRKSIDTRMVSGFIELSLQSMRKKQTNNLRIPLFENSQFQISEGIESFHALKQGSDEKWLPDFFGQHIINILSDIDMVSEAVARKTFDAKLFDYASDFGGYDLPIMIEQTPKRDNRIYLGKELDNFGLKKHLVDWTLHKDDIQHMWESLEVVANELGQLGIGRLKIMKEFEERLLTEKLFFSHHHMGTTRMAKNEGKGVVDGDCKVFNTQNLYICGSSVFTTGSHVPPTLTIIALTLRLAKHLSKQLKANQSEI
jgi:choline dehydrogenase-like flavoprotein